jgi:hypothetical protein
MNSRDVAQAVRPRHLTVEVGVHSQSSPYGVCDERNSKEQYLGFEVLTADVMKNAII